MWPGIFFGSWALFLMRGSWWAPPTTRSFLTLRDGWLGGHVSRGGVTWPGESAANAKVILWLPFAWATLILQFCLPTSNSSSISNVKKAMCTCGTWYVLSECPRGMTCLVRVFGRRTRHVRTPRGQTRHFRVPRVGPRLISALGVRTSVFHVKEKLEWK